METEYSSCEVETSSSSEFEDEGELGTLVAANFKFFQSLQEQWPGGFFQFMGDEWEVGRLIAKGAMAEIFEVEQEWPDGTKEKWALKVFYQGFVLQDLSKQWPRGMLETLGTNGRYSNGYSCSIYGGMMLWNGRFAFLMKRYWGDLRKLIDLKMRHNNNQDSPFTDDSMVIRIMLDIALGMQALHEDGIVHGDLKAPNVLIWPLANDYDPTYGGKFQCHVADFECSVGVMGTRFWRAPEILLFIKNRVSKSAIITEKSDVYSFAMTCYEILTGRIPFEDRPTNDYDVVISGKRPPLPEHIDFWIKELLGMCWHEDPVQRPTFKEIVDILEERSRKTGEPDIPAPRSSTWEELNDPRARSGQDLSTGFPEKFPILIEILPAALQRCEEEVVKIKSQMPRIPRCEGQVGAFEFQRAHLVETLSPDADKIICRFRQIQHNLKKPGITNAHRQRFELSYWFKCVTFGIHSLVDLTRSFQLVVEILANCGAKERWRTAFQLSTPPPHPQIPRWSMFGLALRQCQWSMDIAQLAIKEMTALSMGRGDWMFNDSGFRWCGKRQRSALQYMKEHESSGSLGVAAKLEAKDTGELVKDLDTFLNDIPAQSSFRLPASSSAQKEEFTLASFLMTKLDGPVPQASYLPYSFQIDPAANMVLRSPSTAMWCDKLLRVKSVEAQGFNVRKIIEVEAAPLATVQHPNVVQLIGCTFKSPGHATGMTKLVTKLKHPSKKKLPHQVTGMLVMELMDGDLRSLIDGRCPNPGPGSRPFSLIVAIDIMLQIAEAMRFVHEHKILHRDLKTTNILFNFAYTEPLTYPTLDADHIQAHIRAQELFYLLTSERYYTVKLADFGKAKYTPNESSHIVDAMIGTPRYMAPEMFYNSEAEVPSEHNWSCDVYSFAMTCSAILTGHEPFHFVKNTTVAMAPVVDKLADVLVRPELGLGDALPTLKDLIERCWDKDSDKRPPFSEICKTLWACKVETTISSLWR